VRCIISSANTSIAYDSARRAALRTTDGMIGVAREREATKEIVFALVWIRRVWGLPRALRFQSRFLRQAP
jgi:hypothetical protein